jgi:hypothetical protein
MFNKGAFVGEKNMNVIKMHGTTIKKHAILMTIIVAVNMTNGILVPTY